MHDADDGDNGDGQGGGEPPCFPPLEGDDAVMMGRVHREVKRVFDSFFAKLALRGEPCGQLPFPALVWATEVWRSGTTQPGFHFSLSDLSGFWVEAEPWNVVSLRSVKLPMAVMILSLRRVGRNMVEAFRWIDEFGTVHCLLETPPALLFKFSAPV